MNDAAATTTTCPTCHEPVAAGDVFCESCGAELDPAAAVLARAAITAEPTAAAGSASEDGFAPACPSCGATTFADGFCASCGAKQPVWRDHFTEAPTAWIAGVCDKGVGRNRNEDAMAMAAVGERAVLVVCDGVTTAPDSDRASLDAAKAARDVLTAAGAGPAGTAAAVSHWSAELRAACEAANREAVAVARTLGDPPEAPSCTYVAAVAEDGMVHTAWCGDSRSYWLPDGGEPAQLTVDHSLGTEMVRAGMSRAEAEADPTSHTITRWLGADSVDPSPEVASVDAAGPGWLVVCSDGLWNHLSDAPTLRAAIDASGSTDPFVVADALVDLANAGGGHDNITAVLARIGDTSSIDTRGA